MCYVLYGVGLSYIVLTIITMMTAFPHMAINLSYFIVLIKFNIYRMCFYEYLSFSGMMLVL